MRQANRWRQAGIHIILIAGAAIMVLPFLWMLGTSLKSSAESMLIPPTIVPHAWLFSNYADVMHDMNFGRYFWNTFVMTAGRTVGQLFLCSLAAYAFAALKFPGKSLLFILVLSAMMVPAQIMLIPNFITMRYLGWVDSYFALIVPTIASAFGTFLLRQFFMSLPRELGEASKIDGCSYFRTYRSIYMPLTVPALISLTIFVVIASWNDFIWPLVVTNSDPMRVLSIGIASYVGQFTTNFPLMMAAATMATAPLIVIFVFLQRYFIEGIALSGVKG